jgi:hypothetical protein
MRRRSVISRPIQTVRCSSPMPVTVGASSMTCIGPAQQSGRMELVVPPCSSKATAAQGASMASSGSGWHRRSVMETLAIVTQAAILLVSRVEGAQALGNVQGRPHGDPRSSPARSSSDSLPRKTFSPTMKVGVPSSRRSMDSWRSACTRGAVSWLCQDRPSSCHRDPFLAARRPLPPTRAGVKSWGNDR